MKHSVYKLYNAEIPLNFLRDSKMTLTNKNLLQFAFFKAFSLFLFFLGPSD